MEAILVLLGVALLLFIIWKWEGLRALSYFTWVTATFAGIIVIIIFAVKGRNSDVTFGQMFILLGIAVLMSFLLVLPSLIHVSKGDKLNFCWNFFLYGAIIELRLMLFCTLILIPFAVSLNDAAASTQLAYQQYIDDWKQQDMEDQQKWVRKKAYKLYNRSDVELSEDGTEWKYADEDVGAYRSIEKTPGMKR